MGGTVVAFRSGEADPAVVDQVRRVLPRAVRAAARWGAMPPEVALTLHASHGDLEAATNRRGNPWMRAWARRGAVDLQSPRTWSRGRATDSELAQILSHELTHCALFHAVGRDAAVRGIPHWFLEGMASVAAEERHDVAIADALARPAETLRVDPAAAYGTADRAFRALLERAGDDGVRRIVALLGEGASFADAFRDGAGVPLADFEREVRNRLTATADRG